MTKLNDLTGQRFGKLTVVQRAAANDKRNRARWLCVCDCGTKKVVAGCHLISGDTRSCGCLRREVAAQRSTRGTAMHDAVRSHLNMDRGQI